MDQSQVLHLNSGYQMPLLGFGTWKVPKSVCSDTVYNAIKHGYRLIDCACDYGNEKEVGQGIKRAIQDNLIKREDLFVVSKLWNTFHRPEHVYLAFNKSLTDLGLQYLDLYLIHFPISLKFVPFETRYPPEWLYDPHQTKPRMEEEEVPIIETWKVMEQIKQDGLVRSIGVSNFNVSLIRDLWYQAKTKPAVLQVQIHPYLTQKNLIRFCRQKSIQITSYSTFGAASYISISPTAKENQIIGNEKIILDIGQKYKKSGFQIVLRWAVQQGLAVIPKSQKQERMKENSDLFSFSLTEDQMNQIDKLNRNRRFNNPAVFCEAAFNTYFPIYD